MNGLKKFNRDIISSLPVNPKVVDDFPSQPYIEGSIVYHNTNPMYLGLSFGYHSTGSRISYKDYSGELKIDNVLSAYSPGIVVGAIITDKVLVLKSEANFSYSISNLEIIEQILSEKDQLKLESHSFQLEPRIRLTYLLNEFEFGLRGGYLIDFGGKYSLEGNPDSFLENGEDDAIKSNWSGIRFGLSVAYNIHFKKE